MSKRFALLTRICISSRRLLSTLVPSENLKSNVQLVTASKCFEGEQRFYKHYSKALDCDMTFGVYLPPAAMQCTTYKCPALYCLSCLTCSHENFIFKSGVQRHAAKHNLLLVNPDTSPRNVAIAEQQAAEDVGASASFYIDATELPWCKHYKMHTYITQELPTLVNANFPVLHDRKGICGHSMGGHGALICALKCPSFYQSVSAFAPIANLINCPTAQRALHAYLGDDINAWQNWDASCLAKAYSGAPLQLFIDQGGADLLLEEHLKPQNLLQAAAENERIKIIYKERYGYGHNWHFVATFIEQHIDYHAKLLNN